MLHLKFGLLEKEDPNHFQVPAVELWGCNIHLFFFVMFKGDEKSKSSNKKRAEATETRKNTRLPQVHRMCLIRACGEPNHHQTSVASLHRKENPKNTAPSKTGKFYLGRKLDQTVRSVSNHHGLKPRLFGGQSRPHECRCIYDLQNGHQKTQLHP